MTKRLKRSDKSFGATIRRLRKARKMSMDDLGDECWITESYLSIIERNKISPPSAYRIINLAKALDQDPDELLALAGRIPPDLEKIILRNLKKIAELIRAADGLTDDDIDRLIYEANRKNDTKNI